ncbi:MAG: hypothetical protein HRU33_15670 [Rhodobacteraceae bacterium]|nr:hypothetical protein [Paracoccaceae bacterium]
MFLIVTARCPKCDEEIEFQSKAGDCLVETYDAELGVPPEIAVDLQFDFETCYHNGCNATIELIPTIPIPIPIPITNIAMRVVIKR